MATIEHRIEVDADPQHVFDTLVHVEHYPRYSKYIKDVRCLAPNLYRWRAGMWGLSMEWEGIVTEIERPHFFSWNCTKGFKNIGSIHVQPNEGGSIVLFTLEYAKGHKLVERVISLLLRPSANKWISEQILGSVKIHVGEEY